MLTPKNWGSFQHYKDRAPAWIKLHRTILDNAEYQRLPVASRALAPMLWLLAAEYDNGEITMAHVDIAWRLRMSADEFETALKPLIERGFFLSSELLADCKQDAIPEKEEEKQEQKEIEKNSRSKTTERAPSRFEDFWKAYPRRDGPNPRKDAEIKFNAMVKSGVDPQTMIDAAKQLHVDEQRRGNIGTRFIPQAVTWLNGQRWIDHAAQVVDQQLADDGMTEIRDQEALDAWDAYARSKGKGTFPRNKAGGWRFPTKYPPGYVPCETVEAPEIKVQSFA